MSGLTAIVIGVAIFGFMLYRQVTQQAVTTRGLIVPVIAWILLAAQFHGPEDVTTVALLGAGILLGLLAGVGAGLLATVFRDPVTGTVYRRGGWKFIVLLVALIIFRLGLRFALAGLGVPAELLNDATIAMTLGLLTARTGVVYLRALALVGGNIEALNGGARGRAVARGLR